MSALHATRTYPGFLLSGSFKSNGFKQQKTIVAVEQTRVRFKGFASPNDHPQSPSQNPFWRNLLADTKWGMERLAAYLAEQPSQIKYIEWPTFQSTIRTAVLTLVIVAMLMVALSCVDTVLCILMNLAVKGK